MIESKFYKKNQHTTASTKKPFFSLRVIIIKVLLTIIVTLLLLIGFKLSTDFKQLFNKYVYQTSFPFAELKEVYQDYFGTAFLSDKSEDTTQVFTEKLVYSQKNLYHDGVALTVNNHYMVPSLNSGIVVFIGPKDVYGNTVIVQQMDGVDVWYGNIDTTNVALYDYVEKGSLIGETKDKTLYLAFQKEGNFVDYNEYVE